MATRITATEIARNLSDVFNRVRYRAESFAVERSGETIAIISPVQNQPRPRTGAELLRLGPWPKADPDFADDLEAIIRSQPVEVPRDPWES